MENGDAKKAFVFLPLENEGDGDGAGECGWTSERVEEMDEGLARILSRDDPPSDDPDAEEGKRECEP